MNPFSNPILSLNTFVPDVEAHVWADGRIYLYGSLDLERKMQYCCGQYHVYSSDDLVNWVDHGVSFDIAWAPWAEDQGVLYAPDCAFRNGKYYLYYCVPDGRCGVAASDSPVGPFADIGPIAHVHGIDPAVFQDEDGQAYLYWGQFDQVRCAKLKENMVEIDPGSVTQPLSVAEHEFHEGSSVKKINGRYYYLFTDTHRHGGKATSLGYAVSDRPMDGFVYKGVILDNFGCDPASWNNHGSMECFRGQWYLFYHRSTHDSCYSRHVCLEPITIEPDGTIREVKMTSFPGAMPANRVTEACRACEMRGNVRFAGDVDASSGYALTEICSGDSALYRYLRFDGENTVTLNLRTDGELRGELYLDGWYLACLTANAGDGYQHLTAPVPAVTGIHSLELRFYGTFSRAALSDFVFFREG